MQKKYILVAILSLFAVFVIIGGLILYPITLQDKKIVIKPGDNLNSIALQLENGGFIISRDLFESYSRLTGKNKKLQAGDYVLPDRVSIVSLVRILSSSEGQAIQITIPEGFTVADIDKLLADKKIIQPGALLKSALANEGYFFPETYKIGSNTNLDSIISKLKKEFLKRYPSLESEKNQKVVIIASMLEREAQTVEDMMLIAGIIQKRLKLGIPLQIDATVAYGVCYRVYIQGTFCNPAKVNLRENIKIDGPYNTYTRGGLPVAPISNPGDRAIQAALTPKASDFLYYLHTRDGRTIYSKTFEEHEENRAKYL